MELLGALVLNGVQFVVMCGVAVGAVILGAKVKKAKASKKEE